MKLKFKTRVTGRGNVFVFDGDSYDSWKQFHVNEQVIVKKQDNSILGPFVITGIEAASYQKSFGLILRMSDVQAERIDVGDEIIKKSKEE